MTSILTRPQCDIQASRGYVYVTDLILLSSDLSRNANRVVVNNNESVAMTYGFLIHSQLRTMLNGKWSDINLHLAL